MEVSGGGAGRGSTPSRSNGRAIYCADVSGGGGALRHRDAIARLLHRFGWDVRLVHGVAPPLRVLRRRADALGAGSGGGLGRLVRSVLLLANSLERTVVLGASALVRRPNAVLWRPGLFQFHGLLVSRALRLPLVVEWNAPAAEEADRFRSYAFLSLARWIERRVVRGAARVIAVSEECAEGLGHESVVVPNGGGYIDEVEVAAAEAWGRSHCPLCRMGEAPTAVILESFRAWHAKDERRVAVSALPDGWNAVVVGDGPARIDFAEWASARRGGANVLALGRLEPEAVQHILSYHADLGFVLYPRSDGFYFSPLKFFDLLAHGLAVVATDIGQVGRLGARAEAWVELVPAGDLEAVGRVVRTTAARLAALGARRPGRPQPVLTSPYGWRRCVRDYARVLDAAVVRPSVAHDSAPVPAAI